MGNGSIAISKEVDEVLIDEKVFNNFYFFLYKFCKKRIML